MRRRARVFGLLALMSCSSTPPAGDVVFNAPAPRAVTAAPEAPRDSVIPDLPPGRAGWFEIGMDEAPVDAVKLPDGRCLAASYSKAWLVKPTARGSTPCDGDAVATITLPSWVNTVHALGSRVAYHFLGGEIWIAQSPEQEPAQVKTPFVRASDVVTAGDALLVSSSEKKLYRLGEQDRWLPIDLDGSGVSSVLGSRNGEAYAITGKKGLYGSIDAGKTWKRVPSEWREMDDLVYSPFGEDTGDIKLYGADKSGARGLATLATNVKINAFRGAHIRKQLPEGVTDRNGIPLARVRVLNEALRGRRQGCGFASIATELLGVIACNDATGFVVMMTDDGGVTVREVHREPRGRYVRSVDIVADEILLVIDCAQDSSANCSEKEAIMLSRTGDA